MTVGYPGVPTGRINTPDRSSPVGACLAAIAQLLQQVCIAVNGALSGKTNNVGTVTCTAGATSTVVLDNRISPNSAMPLDAETANAAAELGAGTAYWLSRGKGTATLTHANAVSTDRRFRFAISG